MKGQWTSVHFSVELSNATPVLDIVSADDMDSEKWLFIRGGIICVTSPAQGGGGRLQIRSTDGDDILLDMDVNAIKETPLYYGDPGLRLSTRGAGLQALVYGAGTAQATVFVSLVAIPERRSS